MQSQRNQRLSDLLGSDGLIRQIAIQNVKTASINAKQAERNLKV